MSRKRAVLFLTLGIILVTIGVGIVSSGCGQQAAEILGNILEKIGSGGGPQTGEVTGIVKNYFTEDPLSGVTVFSGTIETTTDSQGKFTLEGLPQGTIEVSAVRQATMNGTTVTHVSTVVTNASILYIPLLGSFPTGEVSVYLKDTNGNPLNFDSITVSNLSTFYSGYFSPSSSSTEVNNAPAGNIIVAVGWTTGEARYYAYGTGSLPENGSAVINITAPPLSDYATISGTLTMPSADYYGMVLAMISPKSLLSPIPYMGTVIVGGPESSSASGESISYSFKVPPTSGDTKYSLWAVGGEPLSPQQEKTPSGGSWGKFSFSLKFAHDITIGAGETLEKNFTILPPVTVNSPSDGATGTGATPTFSWSQPAWDSAPDAYAVWMMKTDSSDNLFLWNALTPKTSITYPDLPGSTGILASGKQYVYLVWGANISGGSINNFDITNLKVNNAASSRFRFFTR